MSATLNRVDNSSGDRLNPVLLAANVVGAIIYVLVASRSWAIPQERGLQSTTGEPFTWAIAVVPIFVVFILVNVSWGAYICLKRRGRSRYFWLLSAILWLVAICVDFAHH
jgi:hypothetical protein